jgi:hypothetical protein
VLPAQSPLLLHSCNLIWRDAERDHQDQQHGRALRYLRIAGNPLPGLPISNLEEAPGADLRQAKCGYVFLNCCQIAQDPYFSFLPSWRAVCEGTALSIAAASPTGPVAPLSTNTRRHFATLFSLMDDPKNVGHSPFFPSLRQHMITVVQLLR